MTHRECYGKVSLRNESRVTGRWEDRNAQTPGKGPCKRELSGMQEERLVLEVQGWSLRHGRVKGTERRVPTDTVNPTGAET